jgi:hypothetical protein
MEWLINQGESMLQQFLDLFKHSEQLLLVFVCFNIALSAAKLILDKVAESSPEQPGSLRQKVHYYLALGCEWLSKLIDWLTANRAH